MPLYKPDQPQFLGRAVWSSGAVVGPLTIIPKKHLEIRLIVGGYAGGGGIASAQVGNTTTIDSGTNYAITTENQGAAAVTTSVSLTGMRVAGTTATASRFSIIRVTSISSIVKRFLMETNSISVSAATAPTFDQVAGLWVNTSGLIGVVQFTAFSALTGTTTVNFLAGTEFSVWGRDDE